VPDLGTNAYFPALAVVAQLDKGPPMVSTLLQCEIDAVRVDMLLEGIFEHVTPEWTLVKFKSALR
jgi:hypothetical protein